jgi:hypothetical protein
MQGWSQGGASSNIDNVLQRDNNLKNSKFSVQISIVNNSRLLLLDNTCSSLMQSLHMTTTVHVSILCACLRCPV